MAADMKKIAGQNQEIDLSQQNEILFRTLIENSLDAVVLTNAEGQVTYVSPSIERILGYTPDELKLLHASEVIHPADRQATADLFAQLLAKPDITVTTQYRVRHKNGSWRWVEGIWKNLLAEPYIQSVFITIHDITERKQAEQRQQILNQASTILVSSLDHQITLKEVAELIVPALADYCRIALIDEDRQIRDFSVNHIDPEKITLVKALYEEYKDMSAVTYGVQRLLATGKPEFITHVSERVLETVRDYPSLLAIVDALELKSY